MSMPVLADRLGNKLELGTMKNVLEWNAPDAIPSWLTVPGSWTADTGLTDLPGLRRLTVDSSGMIITFPTFSGSAVSRLSAMEMDVYGMEGFTGCTVQHQLYPDAPAAAPVREGAGSYFRHNENGRIRGSNAWHDTPYGCWFSGYIPRGLNLGFTFLFREKWGFIREGNDIVGAADLSSEFVQPLTLTPKLRIDANNPNLPLKISGLKLTLWYV